MPFSEKWQNNHGNEIHTANLLNSIEDLSYKFKLTILSIIYTIEVINIVSHENIWGHCDQLEWTRMQKRECQFQSILINSPINIQW